MTLGEALEGAAIALQTAGVEAPAREARLLASHMLGIQVSALTPRHVPVDPHRWASLVGRRAAREPLAYIVGQRGFWTLDLAVGPDTLVPRPDSETLIEAALAALPERTSVHRILDLGTGTGCLLLAALSEFEAAFGLGVDVSQAALRVAVGNAESCGLAARTAFVAGNWAACLAGRFDLVLCNPPYIASGDLAGLMPEIRRYEPAGALDGGPTGLDCYTAIIPALGGLLHRQGVAVLELGEGQHADVLALAQSARLTHVDTRHDLAGIPRAVVLRGDR